MLNLFKPTWMVEAIYQITPEQLNEHGIKAVLTDLDNTLIAWNNPNGTEELIAWISAMKTADIPIVILSNNNDERVKRVADVLGVRYVARALKPLSKGFNEATRGLELSKEEILMVGDQIMTDIWGANLAGIQNVLVKPILNSDAWNTKINRFFELHIMNHLIKKDPNMRWRTSIHDKDRVKD
ncbi:YqeG family HAD IIIA-type phosphatase [Desemzia sp. FAM 24101]|uniref:YqeG family HAD IIIA-type phosphatase n=1 Tax=unclassified Desemzia TaxID=2685243 RepID=UPI003886531A